MYIYIHIFVVSIIYRLLIIFDIFTMCFFLVLFSGLRGGLLGGPFLLLRSPAALQRRLGDEV